MPPFRDGTYVNTINRNGHVQQYIRISAGPQRGRYVHQLVAEQRAAQPDCARDERAREADTATVPRAQDRTGAAHDREAFESKARRGAILTIPDIIAQIELAQTALSRYDTSTAIRLLERLHVDLDIALSREVALRDLDHSERNDPVYGPSRRRI